PRTGYADDRAEHSGDRDRDEERQEHPQDAGRPHLAERVRGEGEAVRSGRHERGMTERQLSGAPDQKGETRDRAQVRRAEREQVVAVRVEQEGAAHREHEHDRGRRPAARRTPAGHARRPFPSEKTPCGRTNSTTTSNTRIATGPTVAPQMVVTAVSSSPTTTP